MVGALTVRENLHFSAAALRLPKAVSKAQRVSRINTVLIELGLTVVADMKVVLDTYLS